MTICPIFRPGWANAMSSAASLKKAAIRPLGHRMRLRRNRDNGANHYAFSGAKAKRHAHAPSPRPSSRSAADDALPPRANVPQVATTALSFGTAFRRWHDRAHHLAMIISQLHRSRFSSDVGIPQDAERKSLRAHDIQGFSILFNAIAHWSFPPDAIPGAHASYHHALIGWAIGPV
jgi:hypothetical protein